MVDLRLLFAAEEIHAFAFVARGFALTARAFALVGRAFTLVGRTFARISLAVASIRGPVTPLSRSIAGIGCPIARIGGAFARVGSAFALPQGRLTVVLPPFRLLRLAPVRHGGPFASLGVVTARLGRLPAFGGILVTRVRGPAEPLGGVPAFIGRPLTPEGLQLAGVRIPFRPLGGSVAHGLLDSVARQGAAAHRGAQRGPSRGMETTPRRPGARGTRDW